MTRRSDQRAKRLLGTLVGAAFCLVGAYAALSSRAVPDPGGRVLWYGITALVIGLVAIASSWWVEDVDRIWCRHPPRRWR
jgi:hypothetical protein